MSDYLEAMFRMLVVALVLAAIAIAFISFMAGRYMQ